MNKIPTLFQRNYDGDHLVRNEVTPGCEWILNGEGIATRKWDGTCCLIKDGKLFKRYDLKQGRRPPVGFIPAQEADKLTGHWPGWLLVGDGPDDQWHREALSNYGRIFSSPPPHVPDDGTYELIGPKINGNSEGCKEHGLVRHGVHVLEVPYKIPTMEFQAFRSYLQLTQIEGIVFWHPDGRMAKIKRKDFGLKWPL